MPTQVIVVRTDTPEETEAITRAMQVLVGTQGFAAPAAPTPAEPPIIQALPEAESDSAPIERVTTSAARTTKSAPSIVTSSKLPPLDQDPKYPVCLDCAPPKKFVNAESLAAHRARKHGEPPAATDLRCPDCGEGPFRKQQGLTRHRNYVHPEATAAESRAANPVACPHCEWRGKSWRALRVHGGRAHRSAPVDDE